MTQSKTNPAQILLIASYEASLEALHGSHTVLEPGYVSAANQAISATKRGHLKPKIQDDGIDLMLYTLTLPDCPSETFYFFLRDAKKGLFEVNLEAVEAFFS